MVLAMILKKIKEVWENRRAGCTTWQNMRNFAKKWYCESNEKKLLDAVAKVDVAETHNLSFYRCM